MIDNNQILEIIKKCINEYDRVYLLKNTDCVNKTFFRLLSGEKNKKNLLLVKDMVQNDISECEIDIQVMSYEEYCGIEQMYYMYEFSDHIHMLADDTPYSSLINYISSGILTEEEAFMALIQ